MNKQAEKLVEWVGELLYNSTRPESKPPWFLVHENDEDAIFCNKIAKQILFNTKYPLALIDMKQAQPIDNPYLGKLWIIRQDAVIPLAEAMKETE